VAAVGTAHRDAKVVIIDRTRDDRVIDPFEVVAVDVLLGAEWPLVERKKRRLRPNLPRALRISWRLPAP
jgi:hypothetical protein